MNKLAKSIDEAAELNLGELSKSSSGPRDVGLLEALTEDTEELDFGQNARMSQPSDIDVRDQSQRKDHSKTSESFESDPL